MVGKTKKKELSEFISLEKKNAHFDSEVENILEEIRSATGRGMSLEEVMGIVWNLTRSLIPHDRIGLSFVEKDGQRIISRYFKTSYDEKDVKLGKNYSSGLSKSTLGDILRSGKARIINDLESYYNSNNHSKSTKLLLSEGVRSSLTIPLKVDSRNVGFLFFSSRKKGVFTELHALELLEVSEIISQHLEKVWRIFKIEESRKDYLTMLGFVSHEMKSPLASMMTVGSTYLKGYTGKVDPLAEKTMNKMMRISGYLINMVKNYLDLSRLESGEMNFQPESGVKFREEILDFAIDTVSARAAERRSEFVISSSEKEIEITCDTDLLRIVLVNLLDNAVKYGDEKISIEIKFGYVNKKTPGRKGSQIFFSVRNKGVGFLKSDSQKLFRRFSRLKQKGTEDRRGTGLGLYLSWWIIQKHGGEIRSDSKPGEWAEFSFLL